MNNTGEKLYQYRKAFNMTQAEVCAKYEMLTGEALSVKQLSKIENDQQAVKLSQLVAFCRIFRTTPNIILGFTDAEKMLRSEVFSEKEAKIIDYVQNKWQGNIHSLIHWIGMYISMSADDRADASIHCIKLYEWAKEKGRLKINLPVDVKLVEQAWKDLL